MGNAFINGQTFGGGRIKKVDEITDFTVYGTPPTLRIPIDVALLEEDKEYVVSISIDNMSGFSQQNAENTMAGTFVGTIARWNVGMRLEPTPITRACMCFLRNNGNVFVARDIAAYLWENTGVGTYEQYPLSFYFFHTQSSTRYDIRYTASDVKSIEIYETEF